MEDTRILCNLFCCDVVFVPIVGQVNLL
jgi:hypothetical protein